MYYFAFVLLALSMLCALAGAAWAVKSLWPRTAPAAGKAGAGIELDLSPDGDDGEFEKF